MALPRTSLLPITDTSANLQRGTVRVAGRIGLEHVQRGRPCSFRLELPEAFPEPAAEQRRGLLRVVALHEHSERIGTDRHPPPQCHESRSWQSLILLGSGFSIFGGAPHRVRVSVGRRAEVCLARCAASDQGRRSARTQNSFPSGSASTTQLSSPVWPTSACRAPRSSRRRTSSSCSLSARTEHQNRARPLGSAQSIASSVNLLVMSGPPSQVAGPPKATR